MKKSAYLASISDKTDLRFPLSAEALISVFGDGASVSVSMRSAGTVKTASLIIEDTAELLFPVVLKPGCNDFSVYYSDGEQTVCEKAHVIYLENYDFLVDPQQVPGAKKKVFTTIQSAADAAKESGGGIIFVKRGVYEEKVSLDSPDITIVGEDRYGSVMSFCDCSAYANARRGGRKPGQANATSEVATLTVREGADGFRLFNFTVRNTFDIIKANQPIGGQCPALRVSADRVIFKNVDVTADQDTLCDMTGRHLFDNCRIEGDVDFICGGAQTVYFDCDIVSDDRINKPIRGYVTAPRTEIEFPYGYLFYKSRLLNTIENPDDTVFLARPWRQHGAVMFKDCYMDRHIRYDGYTFMGNADDMHLPEKARFSEGGTYGAGNKRTPCSEQLYNDYTPENVFGINNGNYKTTWTPDLRL